MRTHSPRGVAHVVTDKGHSRVSELSRRTRAEGYDVALQVDAEEPDLSFFQCRQVVVDGEGEIALSAAEVVNYNLALTGV